MSPVRGAAAGHGPGHAARPPAAGVPEHGRGLHLPLCGLRHAAGAGGAVAPPGDQRHAPHAAAGGQADQAAAGAAGGEGDVPRVEHRGGGGVLQPPRQ